MAMAALTVSGVKRYLPTPSMKVMGKKTITVVCVAHYRDGRMEAVPIPDELAGKIQVAPAELLAV